MKGSISLLVAVTASFFSGPELIAQNSFREPESKVVVDDWSLECFLRADGSPEACQAYHRVLMNNATQIALVATFAVPLQGDGLLYQISLPLGIDLLAGAILTVDVDFSVKLPITRCTLEGCLLEGRLTKAPFERLMNGTVSTIAVQIPGQGLLAVPMSLNGLVVAIRRIEAAADLALLESSEEELAKPTPQLPSNMLNDNENSEQANSIIPTLEPVTKIQE